MGSSSTSYGSNLNGIGQPGVGMHAPISCPKEARGSMMQTVCPSWAQHHRMACDEVYPRQCPCLRAFDLWSACGIRRTRRRSINDEGHTNLPRFGPPEGKDLHPACLILYCLYSWRCYNGAQMQSGEGGRRWRG
jgi:hypothetical protein